MKKLLVLGISGFMLFSSLSSIMAEERNTEKKENEVSTELEEGQINVEEQPVYEEEIQAEVQVAPSVSSDIVEIPDRNLKRALNNTLKVADLDADITKGQIESVLIFRVSGEIAPEISSLEGLQYATNLMTLSFGGSLPGDGSQVDVLTNDLSPLIELSQLENSKFKTLELYSANNKIQNFDQINQLNLNFLNVNIASIADITGLKNTEVKNLRIRYDLDSASKERLPFDASLIESLTAPELLQLSNLEFNRQPNFNNLVNVDTFYIANTNLTDITTLNLNAPLTGVVFDNNNELSNIDYLAKFPNMRTLQARNNVIEDVSFIKDFANKKLQHIELQGNRYSDISAFTRTNLPKVGYLDFSTNYVTDFSPLVDFEGTNSIVYGINQKCRLPEVELGTGTPMMFKDHLGNELNYIDLNTVNVQKNETGTFKVVNGELIWDSITPADEPSFNRFAAANFDYDNFRTSTQRIYLAINIVQNVVPVEDEKVKPITPPTTEHRDKSASLTVNTGQNLFIDYFVYLMLASVFVLVLATKYKKREN